LSTYRGMGFIPTSAKSAGRGLITQYKIVNAKPKITTMILSPA